jgi:dienelactone hydrolase
MKIFLRKAFITFLALTILPGIAKSQSKLPIDVTIDSHGVHLKGYFYVVEEEGKFPTLIMLQGYGANSNDVLGLGKRLALSRINVLTFTYSGIAPSKGLYSFGSSLEDIHAAYTFIHTPENVAMFKIDTASVLIGGVSYGGGLAMTYAIKHPEIKHVISISGNDWGEYFEEYANNPDLKATVDANINRLIASGNVQFEPGGLPNEMLASGLDKIDPDLYLKRNAKILASKDILLICGWNDNVVSIDRYILPLYRELQKEDAEHVKILAFQDNHGYSNSRDEVADVINDWIKNIFKRQVK